MNNSYAIIYDDNTFLRV